MEITISKNKIGTDLNLSFNGSKWRWVDEPDSKSLLWGFDSPRDIMGASLAIREDIPDILSTPWGKAHMLISENVDGVPWRYCMPSERWEEFVKNLVDCLWYVFSDESNSYYVDTYIRNRELLETLQEPHIDIAKVNLLIDKLDNGLKANIKKFLPEKGCKSPKSHYSLTNTVTGRMTITKGPNILTLSKSHRSIIKSRYKGGHIVEIDIQSAEPRVALSLIGRKIEGDIYLDILDSIGIDITRDVAKIATLSALYGASHHSLKSMLPKTIRSQVVLEAVREYFGVRMLERVVNEDHENHGMIFNTHGRKIFSRVPSVNHLIQSSTVDVSFDIFSLFVKKIESESIEFTPVYMIHDAIILDIPKESYLKISKIVKDKFLSHKIKTEFVLKMKEIK
tara:strand:+ start:2646 stop:3830 length:1185 start_codon:yes stop_codon:yes gene_type:complete